MIALELGAAKDPEVKCRVTVVKEWLSLWRGMVAEDRASVENLWKKKLPQLQEAATRWLRVRGPVTAVIATLLALQWKPVRPVAWMEPSWKDNEPGALVWSWDGYESVQALIDAISETASSLAWKRASLHRCGSGLEEEYVDDIVQRATSDAPEKLA